VFFPLQDNPHGNTFAHITLKTKTMKKINLITAIITSFFLLTSCVDKKQNVERAKPKQLIPKELAKELNSNYIKERSELITKALGIEDANAAWYSIEELENYLSYAKAEGERQGIKVNGIRFYLGVYPKDTTKYKEKAGLTTIFLTPTMSRDKNRPNIQKFVGAALAAEPNVDVTSVDSENYGGMGNPPIVEYGNQR
jgi:hypothetical protein